MISNFFSAPPSFAGLLLLSFAMSASNPSLTRDVFALMPVSADAGYQIKAL